jgi:hypothetical protein
LRHSLSVGLECSWQAKAAVLRQACFSGACDGYLALVSWQAMTDDDPLARGRSRLERTASGTRIVIPAKREWPLLLFLLFWFGGWTVAGITVVSELISGSAGDDGGTAFTAFWLGGWLLGWVFAGSVLTWSLAGREIVRVDGSDLVVSRNAGPYKRVKRFARERIDDVRVEPYEGFVHGMFNAGKSWRHGMEMWGLSGGSVVLDYGARTHRFGNKLDTPEAGQIADHIRRELRLDARSLSH